MVALSLQIQNMRLRSILRAIGDLVTHHAEAGIMCRIGAYWVYRMYQVSPVNSIISAALRHQMLRGQRYLGNLCCMTEEFWLPTAQVVRRHTRSQSRKSV